MTPPQKNKPKFTKNSKCRKPRTPKTSIIIIIRYLDLILEGGGLGIGGGGLCYLPDGGILAWYWGGDAVLVPREGTEIRRLRNFPWFVERAAACDGRCVFVINNDGDCWFHDAERDERRLVVRAKRAAFREGINFCDVTCGPHGVWLQCEKWRHDRSVGSYCLRRLDVT